MEQPVQTFGSAAQDRLTVALLDLRGQRPLSPNATVVFKWAVNKVLKVAVYMLRWRRGGPGPTGWRQAESAKVAMAQVIYGQLIVAVRELLRRLLPLTLVSRHHQLYPLDEDSVTHQVFACILLLMLYAQFIASDEERMLQISHLRRLISMNAAPTFPVIRVKVLIQDHPFSTVGLEAAIAKAEASPIGATHRCSLLFGGCMQQLDQCPKRSRFYFVGSYSSLEPTSTWSAYQRSISDVVQNPEKILSILATMPMSDESALQLSTRRPISA
jgi:hypothetical protein